MRPQKINARAEYRLSQSQRAMDSPSLREKFPDLKSLTLELAQYDSDGVSRVSQVKYSVNLAHSRSLFRIDCSNSECIRGDFDLTNALSGAVLARRSTSTGEMRCFGWRNKNGIDAVTCDRILRYTISLAYGAAAKARPAA